MTTSVQPPLLELMGVHKSFGHYEVLKACSLDVKSRETVVIIGPSGSGKSTLLRCVNLLEPPTAVISSSMAQILPLICATLLKFAAILGWFSKISNCSSICRQSRISCLRR